MSAAVVFVFGMFMFGMGLLSGWTAWGDDQGTYYCPKSTDERSGWIHDGRLYTFEREMESARPISGDSGAET